MIISENESAKYFINTLLSNEKRTIKIMEGKLFEGDKDNFYLHNHLKEIKNSIENGHLLILINMDHIYECIYDILNKQERKVGSVLYSRISVGIQRETCKLHPNFKIIVIVDPEIAYYYYPPPFLNRFEKHCLNWDDILSEKDKKIFCNVQHWSNTICKKCDIPISSLFLGYHNQYFYSLIIFLKKTNKLSLESIKKKLLKLINPISLPKIMGSVIKFSKSSSDDFLFLSDILDNFFKNYIDSLDIFLQNIFEKKMEAKNLKFVIYTFSNFNDNLIYDKKYIKKINLNMISSENELNSKIIEYWKGTHSTILIQCSSNFSSYKYINLLTNVINKVNEKYHTSKNIIIIVSLNTIETRKNIKIEFIPNWKFFFIDSLEKREINFSSLIKVRSLFELIENNMIDVISVIKQELVVCVYHLEFKYEKNVNGKK